MIQLMVNAFQLRSNLGTDLRLFDHEPAVVVWEFLTLPPEPRGFFFPGKLVIAHYKGRRSLFLSIRLLTPDFPKIKMK